MMTKVVTQIKKGDNNELHNKYIHSRKNSNIRRQPVSSDNRTYTGIEKTIPLSNDPPIVISMYGNSDFDDMPLENIISEYIKKTDFTKVDNVDKVKKDFLEYIHRVMPKKVLKNI
jgi:hypothetical protein